MFPTERVRFYLAFAIAWLSNSALAKPHPLWQMATIHPCLGHVALGMHVRKLPLNHNQPRMSFKELRSFMTTSMPLYLTESETKGAFDEAAESLRNCLEHLPEDSHAWREHLVFSQKSKTDQTSLEWFESLIYLYSKAPTPQNQNYEQTLIKKAVALTRGIQKWNLRIKTAIEGEDSAVLNTELDPALDSKLLDRRMKSFEIYMQLNLRESFPLFVHGELEKNPNVSNFIDAAARALIKRWFLELEGFRLLQHLSFEAPASAGVTKNLRLESQLVKISRHLNALRDFSEKIWSTIRGDSHNQLYLERPITNEDLENGSAVALQQLNSAVIIRPTIRSIGYLTGLLRDMTFTDQGLAEIAFILANARALYTPTEKLAYSLSSDGVMVPTHIRSILTFNPNSQDELSDTFLEELAGIVKLKIHRVEEEMRYLRILEAFGDYLFAFLLTEAPILNLSPELHRDRIEKSILLAGSFFNWLKAAHDIIYHPDSQSRYRNTTLANALNQLFVFKDLNLRKEIKEIAKQFNINLITEEKANCILQSSWTSPN